MGTGTWAAIDAGPGAQALGVCVRRGLRAGSKPQVLSCARLDALKADDAGALAELAKKIHVLGASLALTLGRSDYRMLVVAEPPVTAEEMAGSMRWAVGPLLDMPLDEVDLAWMSIPTAEHLPSRARQMYVAVAQQVLLNEQAALFQRKAGLTLKAVDVRESAQRNIAALLEREGEGLALLHVGTQGVSISFTFQGELYLDRFIEQPLAEWEAADAAARLKIHERIALPLLRSVDFINRNLPFMPVSRVVLAPLPAALELQAYLAEHLPLQVEQLDLGTVFDLSKTPELREPTEQARYFTALGAALRGGARAGQRQQLNLLDRVKEPVSLAIWGIALSLLTLIGLTLWGLSLRSDLAALEMQAQQGKRQIERTTAEMETMRQRAGSDQEAAALKAEVDALKPKAAAVQSLVDSLRTARLGRPEGYADYFNTLAGVAEQGLWITSVSVGETGKGLAVSGRALRNESVLSYAKRLNQSFAAQGVQFNSVEMTPDAQPGSQGGPGTAAGPSMISFKLY
ncbi:PilN domain-containing protein [Roseateles violae]|uniref:PilN domain-containing protein n=1 Tax=Roseateles violae TaxID=3058042 RepID=A0ABT8DXP8_9BURK|nr:PilN domain-containing protein [Pelomonas sp. PFR6]MDN3921692.1 PilN domain-containing protein [Pelomonas sp. PFR6]